MQNTHSFRANVLRTSVSLALAAGMTSGYGVAFAQDGATDTEGRVEVTGSRIKRSDLEGALPVTVISREDIELSGQATVAELLFDSSFNTFGSFRPQSGSSAQSFAELSLRGLGGGRTLILIDGRRAPVSVSGGSGQDMNSIPLAAVERIEILSDGASAIYGADAMAGVVNVILRRDFQGLEATYGRGSPTRDGGGDTEQGSILIGGSSDRASVMAGFSWNDRSMLFARERPWSFNTTGSIFSNNFREVVLNPDTGDTIPGGFIGAIPGACDFNEAWFVATNGLCRYIFSLVSSDEAAINNNAMFVRSTYQINDDWSTYINGSVVRVRSFGRYAPTPENILLSATSANNPFGEPVYVAHRFDALGPRDTFSDSPTYDLLVGVEGRLGNFDVDFGWRKNSSIYSEVGYNYVNIPAATAFLETGEYDLTDPYGAPESVLNSMSITTNRTGVFKQEEFYGLASFDLMEMGGGMAAAVVGAEFREERFEDIYDQASASGNVGGSAGNSSFGDREQLSAYFEVLLPVVNDFEISLAGRYDDYDDFGSDFSPKVSFRWQPLDNLTLRASWGTGFRAPPLSIKNQLPAFSASSVRDAQTAAAYGLPASSPIQINGLSVGTADLRPETSSQWAVGLAWDATDWLSMTLDYSNVEITDRVLFYNAQTIVTRTLNGQPFPAQFGVIRNPDGSIAEVRFGSGNEGAIKVSQLEMNVVSNFALGDYGRMRNQLQVHYATKWETANFTGDFFDQRGGPGTPKWRATLSNAWYMGDFTVAWNMRAMDRTPSIIGNAFGCDSGMLVDFDAGLAASFGNVPCARPTYVVHDVNATWHSPWNGRITVGASNITNKDPIIDEYEFRGYDNTLSSPYGRVVFFRYTQSF